MTLLSAKLACRAAAGWYPRSRCRCVGANLTHRFLCDKGGVVYIKGTIRPTDQQMLDAIQASGHSFQVLGETVLGQELICVEMGGQKDPPIIIAAGGHATEWAGPLAALRLLSSLETDHKVYLLPCRDPLGMQGFASCLSQVIGSPVRIEGMVDVQTLIDRHGDVVYHDGGVTLAAFGRIGGIVVDESKIRQFYVEQHFLPEIMPSRPDLVERLAGKYLFFVEPWEKGECGWNWGCYDHPAQTIYVSRSGHAGNLNRFFNRADGPIEVNCTRALVDRKYYLVVPLTDDPLQDRIARAMTASIRDRGFELSTLEELSPFWGPKLTAGFHDLGDGIFSGEHMTEAMSLGSYGRRYGPTATTETGMDGPIDQRINFIEWSVRAAIEVFGAHHR